MEFFILFQIVCLPKLVLGAWHSPVGIDDVMDNSVLRELGCCDTRALECRLNKLLMQIV